MQKANFYELLEKYRNDNNYIVKDFNNDNNNCFVFFTSQGIYKENFDVDVLKSIHDSNRYEWSNIASNSKIIKNCRKMIFIRDIGKELYQRGINVKIDSIQKIVDFIKKETQGLCVYLVGSSSGGYIAFIVSQLENVKRVYSFGGLLSIGDKHTYTYLKEKYEIEDAYVSSEPFIGKKCLIIHSFGVGDEKDKREARLLSEKHKNQLILIPISSNMHAARPYGDDIIKLFLYSDSQLLHLKKKMDKRVEITPLQFCFLSGRWLTAFKHLLKEAVMSKNEREN